jgi:demethylmenaquinone methyltransferase/2-methoxy-6-polyprenyl-1,4-benzoquinol methylase
MFDGISPRYDLLNRLLSFGRDRRWRRLAVQALNVRQGERVLDIACGTGDMLLTLKTLYPSVFAVGADFSVPMLYEAKKKNLPAHILAADACALPFADASFDKLTIAFGFRNIPDKPKALSEARRVLKDGGVLGILEFSKPETKIFSALFWFYFKYLLPFTGAVISGHKSAYAYLPLSVKNFPGDREYTSMVCAAGFTNVKLIPYDFRICSLLKAEKSRG